MSSDWKDWEYWVNAFPEYDEMNFDLDSDDFRAYVPFEPIGKKQVGRLVYQVIGKDGPVFNPKNIRYLCPGDSGYPTNLPSLNPAQGVNLSNLTGVLSGLNLVASFANIALSCLILHKISKLERQIEQAKQQILDKLDVIDQKVTHIDIKVREIHLRESLNYLSKAYIKGNTIDLMEIKKFERDIAGFVQSHRPFEYGNLAHRFDLAYDMRERLTAFHSFLFHTRVMVAQAYNTLHGDPSKNLSVDPIKDYRDPEYYDKAISAAKRLVPKTFHALANRPRRDFGVYDFLTEDMYKKFDLSIIVMKVENHVRSSDWKSPEEIAWLWNTDMGLIWRLWKELRGLGNYQKEFPGWSETASLPSKTNQIMIDCSTGEFIA
jgi:hypothetical protein